MSRARDRARRLRVAGLPVEAIARCLVRECDLNPRVARRTAWGWSQRDVAERWNRRWPDDPKTFKNVSYWERYPSPTGHAPSLAVLQRLAVLYECTVGALVSDIGGTAADADDDPLADLAGLTPETVTALAAADACAVASRLSTWSRLGLGDEQVAGALRVLAIGASQASTAPSDVGSGSFGGDWVSRYTYFSDRRNDTLVGEHRATIRQDGARLSVHGMSDPPGSGLFVDLLVEGAIATGTWREHTHPTGYYDGAVYHGTLQLVIEPSSRRMRGSWLGFGRDFTVNHGEWLLERVKDAGRVRTGR